MSIHRIARSISRGITKNIAKEITGRVSLITNGGFENGTTGWVVETDGIFAVETTIVHSGSQAAKLTIGTSGNNISQAINTVTGQSYSCSGWAYLDPTADSGYFYAGTSAFGGVISTPASTTTKGSWVFLICTFTAAGTTTYIGFGLTTNGGDIAYADDIEVYKA